MGSGNGGNQEEERVKISVLGAALDGTGKAQAGVRDGSGTVVVFGGSPSCSRLWNAGLFVLVVCFFSPQLVIGFLLGREGLL